jgi:3-phosphoshikimate 1-carboxyvinyltransferase
MNDRSAEVLEIVPLSRPPRAAVRPPGSKSITNRTLVLAGLHNRGPCLLRGALHSEDTAVMADGLTRLGIGVRPDWPVVRVERPEGKRVIPAAEADLYVANSGTTMRFLTAAVAAGQGRYRLDGNPRMRERPIADLLTGLCQLGVRVASERHNGCPPVVVEADGIAGGTVTVKGDVSSQFLSALLLAAPAARGDLTLRVEGGLVSQPYVAMTVAMMRQWGLEVQSAGGREFRVPGRQRCSVAEYAIEPDASAASYFFGAAAVTGGEVAVEGLGDLQGDVAFVDVLERMGCEAVREPGRITVRGRPLRGTDVDMNAISDCVMTLAAVACFAEGPTTIRNVAHVRHKETDRIAALAAELRRLGAGVEEFADGLTISPGPLRGAAVQTYDDHRMAMSLALVGLRVPGVLIRDPGCVAKTYPHFFADLEKLR